MENTTKHRERDRVQENQRKIFQTIVFSPPFRVVFIYIIFIYKDRLFFRSVVLALKKQDVPYPGVGVKELLVMDIGLGGSRAARTFLVLVF
jgi:hypothetical protein